jgi:hypothetical protein
MSELVGTVVEGYRITEKLYDGSWQVCRGLAPDGGRVLVTVTTPPPPADVLAALAVIESEPAGTAVADLRWPLPISEVVSVGLDLARLLERIHAAGKIHGSLRPQTTWIHTVGGRSGLAGTTPRPELAGLHCLSMTRAGSRSPFIGDAFFPDVIARGEPRSASSDVAQLGMMIYRLATHTSPFVREAGEPVAEQLNRAIQGDIPPWHEGDARQRAVEELAREAFDPARAANRSLAPLLAGLEKHSR